MRKGGRGAISINLSGGILEGKESFLVDHIIGQLWINKKKMHIYVIYKLCKAEFRIRIIGPDPDPHQETLIWIRVPKKKS